MAAVLMLAPENVQVCCTLNDENTDTEVYVELGPLPDPYTRAIIYLAGVFAEQIVLQEKNKRESAGLSAACEYWRSVISHA